MTPMTPERARAGRADRLARQGQPNRLAPLGRHLARFHADEGGNATLEFVLFVPFFMMLFLSTFEMGMLMVRQTMLDRGMDVTVRLIRLNQMVDAQGVQVVNRDNIARSICFFSAGLIPECDTRLRVEMQRMDPHNWNRMAAAPDCVNVDNPADPVGPFQVGAAHELMFIRACALFDPYAPGAGLGAGLHRQTGDLYAMFSTSAYVVEPR